MPEVKFLPDGQVVEVAPNTKVLIAAIRNKIPIRYGCASCQCGTCGIAVSFARGQDLQEGELLPMQGDEQALLGRMRLPTDGSVRLACRAKVVKGQVVVDLGFQGSYSPDEGILT